MYNNSLAWKGNGGWEKDSYVLSMQDVFEKLKQKKGFTARGNGTQSREKPLVLGIQFYTWLWAA